MNELHAPKRPTDTPQGAGWPLSAFPATGDDSWGSPDQIPGWADTPEAHQAQPLEPTSAPEWAPRGTGGHPSGKKRARTSGFGSGPAGGQRRKTGGETSAETVERRRTPQSEIDPASQARDIVLRQLTASAKSRDQLRRKLAEKEIPEDIAEQVLDRFEEVNLVDDTAFADAWVRGRARSRGLARSAIRRELRQKGIDDEQAEEALEQLTDEDEAQTARELVDKKLRSPSMGADREREVRRLVGMLCRKGYGPGLAFRIVGEAWDETYSAQY
ncbi:regulatory protein RecX [Paeniglutamicibacter cryotolerans]|uniref:Regulatory protein RecX n=1 Tax=Paeniglutamicibacter cryotolerans TaxID=670079 RepID=A0A839QQB7_9MICC|nr:regulatory protein RecX [Paeniglutamicibacter cryotolerans]MBB2996186.1 regulatory protein [Paeniglutamicibacter cryotolerans]